MPNGSREKIGFVFDLDGTLLDDVSLFMDLPYELSNIYDVEITEEEIEALKDKLIDKMSEKGSKSLILKLILDMAKEFGIPWYRRIGFLKKLHDIYKERVPNIELFPGTMEVLKELKNKYNAELGIYTTSSVNEIYEKCQKFDGFLEIFDEDLIGRDSVTNLKPSPEGLNLLSEKWNIPTKRIIMVGDMEVDISAGKNAKSVTIGVLGGFSSMEHMQSYQPDFIFDNISGIIADIDQILNKLYKH